MKCIRRLFNLIKKRINSKNNLSYTYKLKRNKSILNKKIMEEAYEVCCELKKNNKVGRIVSEVCDLVYHVLVGLSCYKVSLGRIVSELERRMSS